MKKRLLLIDDNDEWRQFAESALKQAGFEVVAPNNISEFCSLRNLRRHLLDFDLIIIDAILEKDSAIDILYKIKEVGIVENFNYAHSTISVSARLDIPTVVEYMKMGIQNITPKPYELQTLLSIVRKALLEAEHVNHMSKKD